MLGSQRCEYGGNSILGYYTMYCSGSWQTFRGCVHEALIALLMESVSTSETSVACTRLQGAIFQKGAIFKDNFLHIHFRQSFSNKHSNLISLHACKVSRFTNSQMLIYHKSHPLLRKCITRRFTPIYCVTLHCFIKSFKRSVLWN
jgi:hypothetical protein